MRRTGGIIATILTSVFLGIPGLILALLGLIAAIGSQIPEVVSKSAYINQEVQIGSIIFMVGGVLLMVVPIIVGIITLRKKKALESAATIPQAPISPTLTTPLPAADSIPSAPSAEKHGTPPPAVPPVTREPVVKAHAATVQTPGTPAVAMDPSADIRARLLALNRPTAPWHIIDGTSEGVDLIAEWKIVDAQWNDVFAKAKLTRSFRIYLKLDPAKREVRALDKENTVQWHAGFPTFHAEASTFKGQQTSFSFGTGYTFTENLAPGQVYKYKFNSNELKKPIQDAVKEAGWNYKGVAFGKL